MRTVLLGLLHRRSGLSFQLKTARYEVIGTMTLNPKTSQHEMEISEADYLRHAKELARLCQQPTTAVYPLEFREHDARHTVPLSVIDQLSCELGKFSVQPDDITGGGVSGDTFAMGPEETMAGRVIPTFGTPMGPNGIDTTLKFNQLVKAAKAAGVPLKKGGNREDVLHAIAAHA